MKQCLGKPLSHCSARDTAQSPAKSSRCWSWLEGLKSKNDMPNTMLTSIATTLLSEVCRNLRAPSCRYRNRKGQLRDSWTFFWGTISVGLGLTSANQWHHFWGAIQIYILWYYSIQAAPILIADSTSPNTIPMDSRHPVMGYPKNFPNNHPSQPHPLWSWGIPKTIPIHRNRHGLILYTNIYVYIYIYVIVVVFVFIFTFISLCEFMYILSIYIYLFIYIHMYICNAYVYMYIYIYM